MLSWVIVLDVLGISAGFDVLDSLFSASNFCTASKRHFLAALSAELPVVVVDAVAIGTEAAADEVAVVISEALTGTTAVAAAALVVASSSFVSNNDEILVPAVT